jgi:hypothetical protein
MEVGERRQRPERCPGLGIIAEAVDVIEVGKNEPLRSKAPCEVVEELLDIEREHEETEKSSWSTPLPRRGRGSLTRLFIS